jgi:hypothetical protein
MTVRRDAVRPLLSGGRKCQNVARMPCPPGLSDSGWIRGGANEIGHYSR